MNTCDGPGSFRAEDTVHTKPNKDLSLMGLALWQAQKIEKQIIHKVTPDYLAEYKGEKSDPERV